MSNICSCAILVGIHTLKLFLRYSFVYQISEEKTLRSGLHWDTFPGTSSWNLGMYCSSHGGTGWWNHSMSEPFFTLLQIKTLYIYILIQCIFGWFGMFTCIHYFFIMNTAGCFSFGSPTTCFAWQLESWGAVVWENVSTEQLGRFGVDGVLLKLYYRQRVPHLLLERDRIVRHECVFVDMFCFCENTSWT